MTTITKEAVLRAAEKSTPQEALKELFPEYFEEDTLAIKKGVFDCVIVQSLVDFCKMAFNNPVAIVVADESEEGNPARLRSLGVSSDYEVVVRPSTQNKSRTTIEIHHRK